MRKSGTVQNEVVEKIVERKILSTKFMKTRYRLMLSELQVKNAKPKEKYYMLRYDKGLYLRVDPSGRKYWIVRYHENKKEHQISLGPYPGTSLKEARAKRDDIQTQRSKGFSPRSFTDATSEWLKVRVTDKTESYKKTIHFRLNKYILPYLGKMSLHDIKSVEILNLLRKIERVGHLETAKRVKQIIGQIFRFAVVSGWAETDPSAFLSEALQPVRVKHFSTLTDSADIEMLMKSIKAYPYTIMRCAMLFSIYTAARPGEVRAAEWLEIKKDVWEIPAEKMKMKRPHIVPLSTQVKAVLEELRPLTGGGRWLFPSPRNDGRCMSENGVRVALRSLGFTKEQIVPHGFRAMFSTIANENHWDKDVIERQLAHVERNAVRGAYNRAEYLEERVKLMQWWADYLDGISV